MVLTQNRNGQQALADLLVGTDSVAWREAGQCVQLARREIQKNSVSKRFFSETNDEKNYAILLCSRCPVQAECLTFALATEARVGTGVPVYGIFGGFVASKRREAIRSLTIRELIEHLKRRSRYQGIRDRMDAILSAYDPAILDSTLVNANKEL